MSPRHREVEGFRMQGTELHKDNEPLLAIPRQTKPPQHKLDLACKAKKHHSRVP
jgi:hypothetical protein